MRSSSTHKAASTAILAVGNPGSGKTRVCASLPNLGILDCDGNLASAIRVMGGKEFKFSFGFKDDQDKEVPENMRWLWCYEESKKLLMSNDVQSFVVDGLSNLCRWGLIYAEAQLKAAGIDTRKEYLAKYQSFIPLLTNYMTMIRIPQKLVMVTVHQFIEKAELEGKVMWRLDIPGRLADTLGGQFTDCWGTQCMSDPGSKVGAKYFIKTKPYGYHESIKTSLDLEPSIEVTDKTPQEIWKILEPKLKINQVVLQDKPPTTPTNATAKT